MAAKKDSKERKAPQASNLDDLELSVDGFGLAFDDISLDDEYAADGGDDPGDMRNVDVEKLAADEASELLTGFKERAARENERQDYAIDTEYWFCLGFQTREQKEEFLQKIGWDDIGNKYLDGMACADAVGIELTSFVPPMPNLRIDQRLAGLAHRLTSSLAGGGRKKKRIVIVDDD